MHASDVVTWEHRPRDLVAGRYRLLGRPSIGGAGFLMDGTDETSGRPVCVAIVPGAEIADNEVELALARAREATHPGVVAPVAWERQDGRMLVVSERPYGVALATSLCRDLDAAPDDVLLGVAGALGWARAVGLAHPGLTPEYVVIGYDGRARVVGFAAASPSVIRSEAEALATLARGLRVPARDADGALTQISTRAPSLVAASTEPDRAAAPESRGWTRPVPPPPSAAQAPSAPEQAATPAPSAGTPAPAATTLVIDHREAPTAQQDVVSSAPKRKRSIALAGLTVAALVVAGAVAAYAWQARSTVVPGIVGRTADNAVAGLALSHLESGAVTETFDERAPAGTVVGLKPAQGTKVRRGTSVDLVVSKGPDLLPVPRVTGGGLAAARAALEAAGLTLGSVSERYDERAPRGVVLEQSPRPGANVRRRSAVDLAVSKGQELFAVPAVQGRTLNDAKARVVAAGFAFASTPAFSETVPAGTVMRTTPAAATKVRRGTTVTAVVSKGPETFDMPRLVGLTLDAARAKAKSLGLVIVRENAVPGSGSAGLVQGQTPGADETVRKGTKIELYYGAP